MKWYIVAGLLLAAAFVLESGLLAYSMYVLLGVMLISRWLARVWIGNLEAERSCEVAAAEVGETVPVTLTVRNTGPWPVPWVLVEDTLPREALVQRPPRLRVKGKRLALVLLRGGAEKVFPYQLECRQRGYYPVGPVVLETGDVFGLHRRFRVVTRPHLLMVYPRVVPLEGYELASRRPVGEVVLTHRLYEDPTRIAGVRPYERGDPLRRVHWRATARTGELHSKVYEATTLAGATVVLDFHQDGYPSRGEPFRSELAITAAVSLANAVYEMGQQVGLVTNARDAADRLRETTWDHAPATRPVARRQTVMDEKSERLRPLVVPTRRGEEQFHRIRETLARSELTDGMTFAGLILEAGPRLPRDATVVAVLPDASEDTAAALGGLHRQGFAVTAILVALDAPGLEKAHGRLAAEGVRDVRHLASEAALPALCQQQVLGRGQFTGPPNPADPALPRPAWMEQTPYEVTWPED